MTRASGTHTARFFVQIEPEFSRSYGGGDMTVSGIKAVLLTQKYPSRPKAGTLTVELEVNMPDAAFLPLRPKAIIEVPSDYVAVNPIQVTVGDASDNA